MTEDLNEIKEILKIIKVIDPDSKVFNGAVEEIKDALDDVSEKLDEESSN